MGKFSEKDVRKLELPGTVTASLVAVLCIMYLLDIVRNRWMLEFLLVFGVILHLFVALSDFVRRYYWRTAASVGMLMVCIAGLLCLT